MMNRIDLADEIKETREEIAKIELSIDKLLKMKYRGAQKENLASEIKSEINERQMILEYLKDRLQRYYDYMHTPKDSYSMKRRTLDSFLLVMLLIAIVCGIMVIFITLGNLLGKT